MKRHHVVEALTCNNNNNKIKQNNKMYWVLQDDAVTECMGIKSVVPLFYNKEFIYNYCRKLIAHNISDTCFNYSK